MRGIFLLLGHFIHVNKQNAQFDILTGGFMETERKLEPLVSVVMPAYNAERFIGEAIESVLRQSYSNWELLVFDDESIDHTAEVVQNIQDSRIRYYRLQRLGRPSAV